MSEEKNQQVNKLRLWAVMALAACYTLPLVILTLYNVKLLPFSQGWGILSLGLIGTTAGSAVMLLVLRRWQESLIADPFPPMSLPDLLDQKAINDPTPEPAADPSKEQMSQEIELLRNDLNEGQKQRDALCEELRSAQRNLEAVKREKEQVEVLSEQQQENLEHQKIAFDEEVQGKETLLEEYQHTITDQRTVIEKKQQMIVALEGEIRDLKYELKTLVDLSDKFAPEIEQTASVPSPRIPDQVPKAAKARPEKVDAPVTFDLGLGLSSRSLGDAQQQLKRCIDIAQKLTGARHLAGDSSRFRDLSADGYALDFRRLCDSLGSEQSSVIILYSQRENKVLFVNNQVRGMLGWSPDKFLQNFPNLFSDGLKEWRTALQKAATTGKCDTTLTMKNRSGEEGKVCCLLGAIPTGIFKTHIVAILYPFTG